MTLRVRKALCNARRRCWHKKTPVEIIQPELKKSPRRSDGHENVRRAILARPLLAPARNRPADWTGERAEAQNKRPRDDGGAKGSGSTTGRSLTPTLHQSQCAIG